VEVNGGRRWIILWMQCGKGVRKKGEEKRCKERETTVVPMGGTQRESEGGMKEGVIGPGGRKGRIGKELL
jgi:hypothetical protein